ncbi:MAG: DUF4440 domain-containing protein [Hyphomicrobiaceae bacterium]
MVDRFRDEIEEVHAFIAAWFRGDVAQDDALFEKQFAARLDTALVNIQPSGQVLTRDDLLTGIRAGYGSNPAFQIEIEDVALRCAGHDLALVTYVEFQRGARNTDPADNRRVSSVLFRGLNAGGTLIWMHIHETGRD